MRRIFFAFNISALLIFAMSACTDPTEVGADLLEGDEAEVGFTDTLSVKATTLAADTILTYFPVQSASQAYASYLLGKMVDPLFGTSTAQVFAQVAPRDNTPDFDPTARLDSIVLVLPYDTLNMYGALTETYGISVHRLTQYIDPEQRYFSNATFSSDGMPLGSKDFVPNFDSVTIFDYTDRVRDTLKVPAQLRIPLDRSVGEELLRLDSATYSRDSLFARYFQGLHLKPTTINNGMLSFNLVNPVDLTNERAGIFLYYTEKDTVRAQQHFIFDPFFARVSNLEHNYSGTVVEQYLNNSQLRDSLIFVQGMAGVITELEVPFANELEGLVVNKAELEVSIATPPGNNATIFEPVPLILLLTPNENGEFEAIDDISLIVSNPRLGAGRLIELYGGNVRTGSTGNPDFYRFNISTHFQKVINKNQSNVLRLIAFNRLQEPARVALYGASHPEYGIKLKVAFTKPPGR